MRLIGHGQERASPQVDLEAHPLISEEGVMRELDLALN